MDELFAVRAAAAPPSALDHPGVAAARARLQAEIAGSTGRPRRRPAAGRRWAQIGLAAAAAAVLVAVLPAGSGQPLPMVPAAQVLELAATAALREPDRTPRPDQFVYSRTVVGNGDVYEAWRSVDGTRDGLSRDADGRETVEPGCRGGRRAVVRDPADGPIPGRYEPCEPEPAYDPAIPGTTADMVTYLRERNTQEDPAATANSIGKDVWELSVSDYLRPAQRAALLRAAALTPGLVATPTTGPHGRAVVAVSWNFGGVPDPTVLVFDATTHEFLGDNWGFTSVGIVDQAGRRT